MKTKVSRLASMLALAGASWAQAPVRYHPEWHRGPYLNLRDPRTVATRYDRAGSLAGARALSTAAADFDEDGMPDLAAGFATSGGAGAVAIHRGNIDALWPYGPLRGTEPPAFHPDARVFELPEPPDFLAAGDFDADGHWDIVSGHAGSAALYLLKGDGHGGFADAERIPLPGRLTAMTSGEINRADGLTDLMVAISRSAGAQGLVFESPDGALRGTPEAFDLPAEATALAVIPLDGGIVNGLAIASGHELLLIHGRDRRLTRSKADRESVPAATVTRQTFSFALQALAVGHFTSPTLDLAALGDDGQIHILERSDADQSIGSEARFSLSGRAVAALKQAERPAGTAPKTTAMTHRSVIGLPPSVRQNGGLAAKLVAARVAATGRDSLIVVDPAGGQVHIVSHSSRADAASMAVSASLAIAAGAPAAVQPMRINKDPLSDLVVLAAPRLEPMVMETSPGAIVTVTNTSDSGDGSLRSAITAAVPGAAGAVEIDFDIPVTDPNRDPTTGVFTIQPVGLNSIEALPGLAGDVTLDAYTQPGASPNTLATGDNAHLLIELNGSMAGSGPSGFLPGGDTIRGFVMTNFVEAPIPGFNSTHGGACIDIESSGNIIEGNFFGIDAGGTFAKPSYLGIVSFLGSYNMIGGTTIQARNIFAGDRFAEIALAATAVPNSFFIQGNYVGTDKTGTHALGGAIAGVGLEGYNTVLGGTVAGARNVVSGNGDDNVAMELNCNQCVPAQGNLVQGNYIGTDPTGTHSVRHSTEDGVVLALTSGITLGGTTPAARNIISGNGGNGVDLLGNSQDAIIEGNYIGLDVSGTLAVGNGAAGVNFGLSYTDTGGGFHNGSPAVNNLIGGEAAGAANVISGNAGAGINLSSASGVVGNNVIAGNLIGTDASGVQPLGNQGDGILLQSYAAGNTVGGLVPGAANTIAYNTGNGVQINYYANTPGNNAVTGNAIYSNHGAGVRVLTGTGNSISHNQIYSNTGLGIDIDAAGVQSNSACQANTAGANLLQDAPVMSAAAGTAYISATATDPAGNTSEFSNCVSASLTGNVLNVAGTLNSKPNTTYAVEYFSNASCDPSGFGQGKVDLGITTVTTNSSCIASLNKSLTLGSADVGVTLTPLFGRDAYYAIHFVATVTNAGPAKATAVSLTDVLPTNGAYILATPSQGTCSFANGTITCNLGDMLVGDSVTVTAFLFPTTAGTFINTVTVASSIPDSNPANNSASFTINSGSLPALLSLTPASVPAGSPDTTIVAQTVGIAPASVVQFGGVAYPATAVTVQDQAVFVNGDQADTCYLSAYCTQFTFTVPAAKLTTVGTAPVTVGGAGPLTFSIVAPTVPIGPATHFVLGGLIAWIPFPNPYAAGSVVGLSITALDANNQLVQSYAGTVNLTSTDPAPTVFTADGLTASVTFPAGAGQATTFVDLQTFGTQSITATDTVNPTITGTLGGIVVTNGPAANLSLTGTPQATPAGQPFAAPITATVTDFVGHPVPNQVVTFTVPTSGPSAVLSSATATTNNLGVASITASANGIPGVYSVGVSAGGPADVLLLNNGNGLATLTATGGTPQTIFLGRLFKSKLQATLKDGLGNPISGATVYFTSGNNNGANAVVTYANVTDANGVASTIANAPINASPGTFPVIATIGGLTATFTLTEVAALPVVVTILGGSPQTTPINSAFSTPLTVHVADGFGTPRFGVVVTWLPPVAGPGAKLSAGTVSTDSSGNASLTAAANGTLGTYDVTASVGGITVDFALTNGQPRGSGPPASIVPAGGTPQSQQVKTPFATALQVLLKDASNTPLSGTSVTFSAPANGASGIFSGSAAVFTDGNGIATAPTFTANTVAGSYLVTATSGTISTSFSLTNTAGLATGMIAYSGNNQSATINTAFGTPLAAQLVDAYGNPSATLGGLTGNFYISTGASGATATANGPTSVAIDSHGIATAPSLTANGTAGSFIVSTLFISSFPVQVFSQVFTLTNTTSVATSVTAISGTPQSAPVGTAFPAALSAKVTDAGNNPLAGFTVTFAPPAAGAGAALSSLSALTNSSGIASVTAAANGIQGSYLVTASAGSGVASFNLKNTGSLCDINQDGLLNVADVQLEINQALGVTAGANDLTADGAVNGVDIQIVINAASGLGCAAR